jgi:predicted metal-dependent hydrolase
MNHSARFWAEVERVMPDYREARKWLRDHGSEIMARMTG